MVSSRQAASRRVLFTWVFLSFFSTCPGLLLAQYGGGSGIENAPYLIAAPNDLVALSQTSTDWDKHFKLTADLDLTGVAMMPIGNSAIPFSGIFNGDSHVISNLTINLPTTDNVGLFGFVQHWCYCNVIFDLSLINPNIIANNKVGSLVGYLSFGTIFNCRVEGGSVSGGGGNAIGGLVGLISDGETTVLLRQCSYQGTVSGTWSVGGLVGSSRSSIEKCFAYSHVSGESRLGGLVGYYHPDSDADSISNSYAIGSVTGNSSCGGLVGDLDTGTISTCYANSLVAGPVGETGGLVGYSSGLIHNSYWDIETSGLSNMCADSCDDTRGKTTAQMQQAVTYVGWGCGGEVWTINEGNDTPWLAWQNQPGTTIFNQWYAGGSGTQNDPFQISTSEQMNAIGLDECNWNKHFKLINDIDLGQFTGIQYNIIGKYYVPSPTSFESKPFSGVFDGAGHVISNLSMTVDVSQNSPYPSIGLFGYIGYELDTNGSPIGDGAEIKKLRLEHVNITFAGPDIGALIGRTDGGTKVKNCSVSDANINIIYVGNGLGLLIGFNNGEVSQCFSTGSATALNHVGGLVGINSGKITECYSHANISGQDYVGGLVGSHFIPKYQQTLFPVVATIDNCYSTGSVTGNSFVGGLAGTVSVDVLIPISSSAIMDSCYAIGNVLGAGANIGALIGAYDGSSNVKSFWDTSVNPGLPGMGSGSDANLIGESTENLQMTSTFTNVGWDFLGEEVNGAADVWRMCTDGVDYPRLRWEYDGVGDWQCPDGVSVEDLSVLADEWLLFLLEYDLAPPSRDGVVNWQDFAELQNSAWAAGPPYDVVGFADQWLKIGTVYNDPAPKGGDGVFNLYDFSAMSANWMTGI